ncbi:hypothetical protein SKAU_G00144080 [Synaphobranchus kaupii]|uniref:Uncharacterized protein n=1 Tax=Synaphobranchus kaupii TaxID=118154 RepID=A0A9Q1FTV3_SYNKA|nr:hypothetical protein SKAU_G00144080 [Synaphobranchus kaupii]
MWLLGPVARLAAESFRNTITAGNVWLNRKAEKGSDRAGGRQARALFPPRGAKRPGSAQPQIRARARFLPNNYGNPEEARRTRRTDSCR